MINQLLVNHVIGFSVNAVVLALIAFLVFRSKPNSSLHRAFAGNQIAISWWSFFTIFMIISPSREWGLFWDRMCLSGVVFIPATLFHYIFSFTKNDRNFLKVIYLNYGISLAFLIILWSTALFVVDVKPKFGMQFYTVPGPFYAAFIGWFIVNVLSGLINLWHGLHKSQSLVVKRQTQLLFWFSVVGYGGGTCNYLLVYDIHLPGVAETSNYAVLLLSLSIAYIIFKYRFLDIEIIIKRTLVFTGVLFSLLGIIAGVTAIAQSLVGKYLHIGDLETKILSVLMVMLVYDPIRRMLMNITDKYLFQKKESIKVILNRLSENVIAILDISKVGKTILATLEDTLRLKAGSIIVKNEDEKLYEVLDAFGVKEEDKSLNFETHERFIQYMRVTHHPVNLQTPEVRNNFGKDELVKLEALNAVSALPLFFQNELIGIMFLGAKKSDQEFSQEEIDYFPTMASQVALAVRNARMHDIVMKSQIDYAQQAKMAAIGTLAAGIGHEVKNPLNNIKGAIGMIKLNKKHNLYVHKTPETILAEFYEAMEVMENNVERAAQIIDRLQSFAKKPKELKVERFNVEGAVEAALSFLATQLEMQKIDIVRNYRSAEPYINADKGAIEDALLNMIANAAHAMMMAKSSPARLTVAVQDFEQEIKISITDTGAGIAKEHLDKIFDPFFTTKDTTRNTDGKAIKGTGLGLFIVREVIKRFGGRITVESQVGKGTTFNIFFPIAFESVSAA